MRHRRPRDARAANPVERTRVTGVIEAIVAGGKGLLRDDDGVLFARGGLVGERVEIAVERRTGGARHGVVERVLQASPERTTPDCAVHPRCGGCDLLDLSARAQRDAKASIVRDALARIARLPPDLVARVEPVRAPADGRGLRRRARLIVDDEGRPAFFARESHAHVPVERCPALAPRLEEALRALAMHRVVPAGAVLQLACDDDDRLSLALPHEEERAARALVDRRVVTGCVLVDGDRVRGTIGDPVLRGEVAPGVEGGPYSSDAATFTQATRFGGRAILEEVLRGVAATPGVRVLELFAGAGHLTLPLARAGADVVAVEVAAHGVRWLEANRETGGVASRVQVRTAFIDGTLPLDGPFDVVVADPPRTGVVGLERLLPRTGAARVILVSCDPATGARDLAKAVACGYILERLVPIDAFPRTSHVEWVATLARS